MPPTHLSFTANAVPPPLPMSPIVKHCENSNDIAFAINDGA
jgi:hypothetical protein